MLPRMKAKLKIAMLTGCHMQATSYAEQNSNLGKAAPWAALRMMHTQNMTMSHVSANLKSCLTGTRGGPEGFPLGVGTPSFFEASGEPFVVAATGVSVAIPQPVQ